MNFLNKNKTHTSMVNQWCIGKKRIQILRWETLKKIGHCQNFRAGRCFLRLPFSKKLVFGWHNLKIRETTEAKNWNRYLVCARAGEKMFVLKSIRPANRQAKIGLPKKFEGQIFFKKNLPFAVENCSMQTKGNTIFPKRHRSLWFKH